MGSISTSAATEPVFVLDSSTQGGTVTLATLAHVREQGRRIKTTGGEWRDLGDVIYVRTPDSLGLCPVYLVDETVNGTVYTHAVSTSTGKRLQSWTA